MHFKRHVRDGVLGCLLHTAKALSVGIHFRVRPEDGFHVLCEAMVQRYRELSSNHTLCGSYAEPVYRGQHRGSETPH